MSDHDDIPESTGLPFLLSPADNPIDAALAEFKEFSGHVVAFGACDGFCSIDMCDDSDSTATGLSDYWREAPNTFYLEVLPNGSVIDLQTYEEEDELDSGPTIMKWVVSAKAGSCSEGCKYDVPNGFSTRIVSQSLNLAIRKTISLWEEETKREVKTERHMDYEAYAVKQMRENKSLYPIVDNVLSEELPNSYTTGKENELSKDVLTLEQVMDILSYSTEVESHVKKVRKDLEYRIPYEKVLQFKTRMKKEEKRFWSGGGVVTTGSLNRIQEWIDYERNEKRIFIESMKKS